MFHLKPQEQFYFHTFASKQFDFYHYRDGTVPLYAGLQRRPTSVQVKTEFSEQECHRRLMFAICTCNKLAKL